jgi:hypothetical protein
MASKERKRLSSQKWAPTVTAAGQSDLAWLVWRHRITHNSDRRDDGGWESLQPGHTNKRNSAKKRHRILV